MISGRGGPLAMKKNRSSKRVRRAPKTVLRLPDLDHAKAAVLSSLSCPDAQRGYRHAIDEFVDWYCFEPRLSFSKTVVIRKRPKITVARQQCRPEAFEFNFRSQACVGFQLCGSSSASRLMGWAAMRERTSLNQA